MKKITTQFLLLSLLFCVMGSVAYGQQGKIMKVHHNGSVVYSRDAALVDSITFDEPNNATATAVKIKMIETQQGTLRFLCETKKYYPSTNYSIDFTHERSLTGINITFTGEVTAPTGIVLWTPTPAYAGIDLGAIENGTYPLNITYGKTAYKGQLIVTSESYEGYS